MTNAREHWQAGWRFVAAMLLAIVGMHAMSPLAEPLSRTNGSAFSSATWDVSLKSSAQLATAKKQLPAKQPILIEMLVPLAEVSGFVAVPAFQFLPATGPPALGKARLQYSAPRAPPFA